MSRWVNSTIIGIGAASLFSDIGHEMATAALPTLLATIGASSAALGLIEGAADGLSCFAKLYSGLNTDRMAKRKPLAVIGYFLTAAGMASFASPRARGTCSSAAVGKLLMMASLPLRHAVIVFEAR